MKICAACKFSDRSILSNECLACQQIKDVSIYALDIDKFKEMVLDENFCEDYKRIDKLVSVFGL